MAEDVVKGLEKMKLTVEEEEIILISDEGRKEEVESCHLSLIGKFLTCKPFNKRAAQTTLRRAWGLDGSVQIVEVGSNLFQVKFHREFDMDRVLKGVPWSFDNQVLLLRRWQPGMTVANVKFDSMALWVQIWGAPFDMLSPKVAEEIGGHLGKVEEVERRKKLDVQSLFMRVKVAVPTSKPLRRGGFIGGSDGTSSWVTFKYERLPLFCHFCGLMGHDLKHCAEHFAMGKTGGEVVYQYGEWLKATGGRARSPQRTGSVKNHQPNHESPTEPLTENRGSPVRRAAKEEADVSIDTTGTLNVNRKDENPGMFPDIMDVVHVTNGTSKETLEPLLSVTKPEELNLNKESTFPIKMPQQVKVNGSELIVGHVEGKDTYGPQGVKTKPT